MAARILSLVLLCAVVSQNCFASPVAPQANKRLERSPQFGYPGQGFGVPEYPRYPGVGGFGAVPQYGFGANGGFGSANANAETGGLGGFGGFGGANANAESGGLGGLGGFGGANANAEAGGLGGHGGFGGFGGIGGGQSEANAQTGNINLGPLSASFSNSQASSGGFDI